MESKQMVFPMHKVLKTLGIASTMLLMIGASQTRAAELRIGVTLHPYYSFVAHIVDDRAEIIPLIDSDSNPHGYAPQANDMIRITSMDVLIVNGIGHDSWAFEILDAAGMKEKLPLI